MEKIIVWGTGKRCAMWQRWLRGYFDIICFVNNEPHSHHQRVGGVEIIPASSIGLYKYDYVIICTLPEFVSEVRLEAEANGIDREKIFALDDFIIEKNLYGKYESDCRKVQIEVIHEILNATNDEITNYEWMYEKVVRYGVFCFQKNWRTLDESINWTFYGLQQVPEEFAQYCIMLSGLAVKDAIEIGVYRGRSSYFVCAVLARRNPALKYILVDIEDRLDGFDEYKDVLPMLEKAIPSTSKDYKGQAFDYVFIDADHSYDASIEDFENVGRYSNVITGFHDIYAHEYDNENGGTVRMWREVLENTRDKRHEIYSKYPDKWMGIGCIMNNK